MQPRAFENAVLRNRLFLEWATLLLLTAALSVWAQKVELMQRLDFRALDYASALARPAPSDDIIIVAIDDQSLAQIGSWPWPRETHARMIDQLDAAGARQIVYDVLFLEPSDAAGDERLAAAIARSGKVILPYTFGNIPNTSEGVMPVYPVADFARGAAALGHVAAEPDPDGVLRRFALRLGDEDSQYDQLVVAANSALSGPRAETPRSDIAKQPDWPVVPFNPPGSFRTISSAELFEGHIPAQIFAGKIAVVGAVAQGMGDRYAVPSGSIALMPGVETQANLLNSLRADGLIETAQGAWTLALGCLVILIQFIAFWRLTPRSCLIVTAALMAGVLAGAALAVAMTHVWVAPGATLLALAVSYPLWSWRRLVSVSAFLESEARTMSKLVPADPQTSGFDVIAQQVRRMKTLVRHVSGGLQFLKRTIETAPDPIIVLDVSGRIALWNDKAAELFPQWQITEEPFLSDLFGPGDGLYSDDSGEIIMPDGRTFLLACGRFDGDADENLSEVVVLRDVTERKQQDEERRHMLEFLSHDMRSPQVAIIGLTQRSASQIDEQERLDRIARQAERTLNLADNFVQLARLEGAGLHIEDADMVSIVLEACDRAFISSREKRISLVQDLPDGILDAHLDPSMIARMLDNLLGNAVKFSPPGSTVTVELKGSHAEEISLTVSDQGPGLPLERKNDPFARFGANNSAAGPSSGLGLAFVKRVVDKHGGRIDVKSAPETGTTFRITLPRSVS